LHTNDAGFVRREFLQFAEKQAYSCCDGDTSVSFLQNDEESIVMTYSTGSGQERAVRLAAVAILHAGFGAALLSMGGYEAIKRIVDPVEISFVPDKPLPPPDAPPPETRLVDVTNVYVPPPIITTRTDARPADPITLVTTTTPSVDPGPLIAQPDTRTIIVEPTVKRDIVKTAALFDARYNEYLQPNYPGIARQMGAEGRVLMEIVIGVDGRVQDVRLVDSSGNSDLDTAAMKHVKKYWRFKPATEDGQPVISSVKRAIKFQLDIQRG
jgi:periplasmic protein TonB